MIFMPMWVVFFCFVFPVLNLEIQKFGPKNPVLLGVFFPNAFTAISDICVAWIRSSFPALRTEMPFSGFNMCFFLKTFHPNSFCLKFLHVFCQSKIRQTKIKCLIDFPIKNKWFLLKQSKIRCLPFMFMP